MSTDLLEFAKRFVAGEISGNELFGYIHWAVEGWARRRRLQNWALRAGWASVLDFLPRWSLQPGLEPRAIRIGRVEVAQRGEQTRV